MNKEFYLNLTDEELIAARKECEKDYEGYRGVEPNTSFLAGEELDAIETEMRRRGMLDRNGEVINSK
jgi:hypothetical protein